MVREMELLQQAGFHPLEAIRAAAWHSAQALGEKEMGWLRPGWMADLIVVEGNPVANLNVLYAHGTPVWDEEGNESRRGGIRYTIIIIGGKVYDAKQVLAGIAEQLRGATTN